MRNLKLQFSVPTLIEKLTANRAKHEADYLKAFEVFREKVRERLQKTLAKVDAREPFSLRIDLPLPEKHLEDYDAALEMLKLTTDKVIDLDHDLFRQLVLDKWDWEQTWTHNTKSYSG